MTGRLVWAGDGHHIYTGDVEQGDAARALDQHGPVDILWTDPPWNPGIAGQMRKWARTGGQAHFGLLVAETIALAARIGGGFIQAGQRVAPQLEQALNRHGLPTQVSACRQLARDPGRGDPTERARTVGYTSTNACLIAFGHCHHHTLPPNMAWMHMTRWCLKASGARSVLDPFLGLGSTLRASLLENVHCVGVELNETRALEAVERYQFDKERNRAHPPRPSPRLG